MDICSIYGSAAFLPALLHIELLYLPSKKTERQKSVDERIITALKRHYCIRHIERVEKLANKVVNCAYIIDILCVMWWLQNTWKDIGREAIPNVYWANFDVYETTAKLFAITKLCEEDGVNDLVPYKVLQIEGSKYSKSWKQNQKYPSLQEQMNSIHSLKLMLQIRTVLHQS